MRFIILGLVWVLSCTQAVFAETYPGHPDIYVNDYANLLSPEQEDELRATLDELWREKKIEMTVLTVTSMKDYGWTGQIEPYATRLFNSWGIGDATRNDGVLLLVALKDRQMRIEIGAGYAKSYDAKMQNVIDNHIIPRFKREEYDIGILRGVRFTIKEITGDYPGEYNASTFQKWVNAFLRLLALPLFWITGVVGTALASPIALMRRHRTKPRICPTDGSRMVRLDEQWDDNELVAGQQMEERLKSVDYDVWQCQQCQHVTIEAYKSWFSRYKACQSCGFHTVEGDETVLVYPTYSSSGTAQIDYHCLNCDARYSTTRTIPMKTRSSSSGGHSSFGGGSSSGGGASGRW